MAVVGDVGPGGEVRWLVTVARDVTDWAQTRAELSRRAAHDELTGLAGRHLFTENLKAALARADRTGQLLAVAFVDIDDLKPINDQLGHRAGDQVLIEIAARLTRRGAALRHRGPVGWRRVRGPARQPRRRGRGRRARGTDRREPQRGDAAGTTATLAVSASLGDGPGKARLHERAAPPSGRCGDVRDEAGPTDRVVGAARRRERQPPEARADHARRGRRRHPARHRAVLPAGDRPSNAAWRSGVRRSPAGPHAARPPDLPPSSWTSSRAPG